MKKLFLIIPAFILLFWACTKTVEPLDSFQSFDRKGMLTSLANSVIVPSFDGFYTETITLETAVNAFANDPTSSTKLLEAQKAWTKMASVWKLASVFQQGPIADKFLLTNIDFSNKGTNINTSLLEKAITDGTAATINNDYIEQKGATVKGIFAIEYLIFDKNPALTVVTDKFIKTEGSTKRVTYLKALATNLKIQAKLISDDWKGPYGSKFINADGRDINSSLGVLANTIIDQIYTIRDERIGVPRGNRNNGTPQPDLAQAVLSGNSIDLIISELKSIENAFLGRTPAGIDGIGIDNLLDKLEAKSDGVLLSTKIKSQFATVYAKLAAIPTKLPVAVVSNQTEVAAAYTEIKKLQVMLEIDMINNLGVLLTFSDNDGD